MPAADTTRLPTRPPSQEAHTTHLRTPFRPCPSRRTTPKKVGSSCDSPPFEPRRARYIDLRPELAGAGVVSRSRPASQSRKQGSARNHTAWPPPREEPLRSLGTPRPAWRQDQRSRDTEARGRKGLAETDLADVSRSDGGTTWTPSRRADHSSLPFPHNATDRGPRHKGLLCMCGVCVFALQACACARMCCAPMSCVKIKGLRMGVHARWWSKTQKLKKARMSKNKKCDTKASKHKGRLRLRLLHRPLRRHSTDASGAPGREQENLN